MAARDDDKTVTLTCDASRMLDHVLDLCDIDWSQRYVRFRGRVVLAATLLFPTAVAGVLLQWEMHEVDAVLRPIERQVVQLGSTPSGDHAPASTGRDAAHQSSRERNGSAG
jgi:hypothetical protein